MNSSEVLPWTRSDGSPRCRQTGAARSSLSTCPSLGTFFGKGLFNSFLVFDTLVGRLLWRLNLGLIQRASVLHNGVILMFFDLSLVQIGLNGSMSIFVRLLISSSVFFSDYYHFWRKNLWKLFKSLHSQRMTLRRFILTVERDSYSFFSFIYQFLTPDFWNLSLLKVFSTYLLVFTVFFNSKKNFYEFVFQLFITF